MQLADSLIINPHKNPEKIPIIVSLTHLLADKYGVPHAPLAWPSGRGVWLVPAQFWVEATVYRLFGRRRRSVHEVAGPHFHPRGSAKEQGVSP